MAYSLAISGKGGSGKTTVAALITSYLVREKKGSVLAVDADPNATLGLALGITTTSSIAEIRDDVVERRIQLDPGMSKDRHIEYLIQQSIAESDGLDLLAMGRPEGPKCYCYVNMLLRKFLDQAAEDYRYLVIDNEAGMEHLSRRTTHDVDLLVMVCEPTVVGVESTARIQRLVDQLPIQVRDQALVVNRVTADGVPEAREAVAGGVA